MHETVQFLERHGLWISRAAWIITNTWWAIPGAVRINPRRLEEYRDVEISPSQEVVLYRAGVRHFTYGVSALGCICLLLSQVRRTFWAG